MPSPTTLFGIAGAALGLPDRKLWETGSPVRGLKVSAWMEGEPGRAKDMWVVLKIKQGKIAERSPYFRELLFFTRYTLIYGGDEVILRRLKEAIIDPAYPLSLGREDELMFVEDIGWGEASEGTPRFRGTPLPRDIRQILGVKPILKPGDSFEPPLVETLPLAFTVDKKGIRHPVNFVDITFIPLGLEIEVPGVPALQWKGRSFAWLNS